jgi:hypothetical protein
MNGNKDDEPAFPSIAPEYAGIDSDTGEHRWDSAPQGGMSLRDYAAIKFAAAALTTSKGPAWNMPMTDYEHLAGGAYKFADAMLAERNKR